jgi:hypothetical protein
LTAPGLISNAPQHSRGCASSAWAQKRPRKKQPDGRKTFRITARTATQFTLSFSLPQISYLTLIDRPFITTYAFIAINVVSASVELLLTQAGCGLRRRTKGVLAAAIPTLYLALVMALMFF